MTPPPASARFPVLRLSALLALGLAAACGDSVPRYTLQQSMLQIDYEDQALRRTLGDPAAVRERALAIQIWMRDPSFERWLGSRAFSGDAEEFSAQRRSFDEALTTLLRATESGDPAAVSPAYGRMRMACEVCHAKFRPGL